MKNDIMAGIPAFVRITIYAQVRRLLTTPYFNSINDREDVIQDLLLFYVSKFSEHIRETDEALVVASIKNYASNLIRTRFRQRIFLHSSLDDIMESGHEDDFAYQPEGNLLFETQASLDKIMHSLCEREQKILMMVADGLSLNEIARQIKISKNTIYKIFERIKKNYKF